MRSSGVVHLRKQLQVLRRSKTSCSWRQPAAASAYAPPATDRKPAAASGALLHRRCNQPDLPAAAKLVHLAPVLAGWSSHRRVQLCCSPPSLASSSFSCCERVGLVAAGPGDPCPPDPLCSPRARRPGPWGPARGPEVLRTSVQRPGSGIPGISRYSACF